MKKLIFIFLFVNTYCFGQNISSKDSLNIKNTIKKVILNFEKPNYKEFKKISTLEIYCIICNGTLKSKLDPYVIYRNDFYKNHLTVIKESKSWAKAITTKEIKFVYENNKRSDITIYLTTWKKNELSKGHEGAQLGLYFKKINNEFKFSGIETIP